LLFLLHNVAVCNRGRCIASTACRAGFPALLLTQYCGTAVDAATAGCSTAIHA
jgi:hypothetical protein